MYLDCHIGLRELVCEHCQVIFRISKDGLNEVKSPVNLNDSIFRMEKVPSNINIKLI